MKSARYILPIMVLGMGGFLVFALSGKDNTAPNSKALPAAHPAQPASLSQGSTAAPSDMPNSSVPSSVLQGSEYIPTPGPEAARELGHQALVLSGCQSMTLKKSADELLREPVPPGTDPGKVAYWHKMVEECRGLTEKDYATIPDLLLAAANGGDRFASLTLCFHPPQKDKGPEAFAAWKEAVVRDLSALGDAEALNALGNIYFNGRLGERNLDIAVQYYERSMQKAAPGNAFFDGSKRMLEIINQKKTESASHPG